jgi:hypothetical protein
MLPRAFSRDIGTAQNADEVFHVAPGLDLPKLIHKVEPKYSREPLSAQVQRDVLFDVIIIDEHGIRRTLPY